MENKWYKYLPKKNQWILVLLVGVLLIVIAMPVRNETPSDSYEAYETEGMAATELEKRLESMLQKMQGVGKTDVMITYKDDYKVEGILVITEGGGNAVIVRNITEVIQALFDVDSHKIKVIEGNK